MDNNFKRTIKFEKGKSFSITNIIKELNIKEYRIIGNRRMSFSSPASIWEGEENSIVFCTNKTSIGTKSKKIKDPVMLINESDASVVIAQKDIDIEKLFSENKTIILVDDPKRIYIEILNHCFPQKINRGKIHPSADIHHKAQIHSSVYIGPNCVIGQCDIGADSIIHANTVIDDNVIIGKKVIIHPGCVIGYGGFLFIRDELGHLNKFPHYGGVIIEDNVEILTLTNIERGTLGNTIIGSGTKIDNLCQIGHNVVIGKNCGITGCTIIGGSTKIGDNSWIAPNASIMDGIFIGEKVLIGLGAVVTKDVPNNTVMVGNPAMPLALFKKSHQFLKTISMEADDCQDESNQSNSNNHHQ